MSYTTSPQRKLSLLRTNNMAAKILTKFTTYREGLFNDNAGLKVSLPAEFNDLFDAQLRFSDDELKNLVHEFNNMSDFNLNKWKVHAGNEGAELKKITTKATNVDAIKYYIERLQTIHILCLNSISAIDFNTSHMWGLYANNGTGIALEFDYIEVDNRFNYTLLKSFLLDFNNTTNRSDFLRNSLNDNVLIYIKEFLRKYLHAHNLTTEIDESTFLESSVQLIIEPFILRLEIGNQLKMI